MIILPVLFTILYTWFITREEGLEDMFNAHLLVGFIFVWFIPPFGAFLLVVSFLIGIARVIKSIFSSIGTFYNTHITAEGRRLRKATTRPIITPEDLSKDDNRVLWMNGGKA